MTMNWQIHFDRLKYISIEINPSLPSKEQIPEYLNGLVKLGVLTNDQKDYILNSKKTLEAQTCYIKFR